MITEVTPEKDFDEMEQMVLSRRSSAACVMTDGRKYYVCDHPNEGVKAGYHIQYACRDTQSGKPFLRLIPN